MRNIIYKEFKLSSSLITYFFILFGLMFFLPGYPILCAPFFVCLGIFKSFQNMIEINDITFSALLPIAKKDIVKGKYIFVCIIELMSLVLMIIATIIRNTLLVNSTVYLNNALMNANGFALSMALVIFSMFNLVFVAGFFKTTYKRTKPFISFIIVTFIIIGISEALHYIPGLSFFNAFGNNYLLIQLVLFLIGNIIYLLITYIAYGLACIRFAKIDL